MRTKTISLKTFLRQYYLLLKRSFLLQYKNSIKCRLILWYTIMSCIFQLDSSFHLLYFDENTKLFILQIVLIAAILLFYIQIFMLIFQVIFIFCAIFVVFRQLCYFITTLTYSMNKQIVMRYNCFWELK